MSPQPLQTWSIFFSHYLKSGFPRRRSKLASKIISVSGRCGSAPAIQSSSLTAHVPPLPNVVYNTPSIYSECEGRLVPLWASPGYPSSSPCANRVYIYVWVTQGAVLSSEALPKFHINLHHIDTWTWKKIRKPSPRVSEWGAGDMSGVMSPAQTDDVVPLGFGLIPTETMVKGSVVCLMSNA